MKKKLLSILFASICSLSFSQGNLIIDCTNPNHTGTQHVVYNGASTYTFTGLSNETIVAITNGTATEFKLTAGSFNYTRSLNPQPVAGSIMYIKGGDDTIALWDGTNPNRILNYAEKAASASPNDTSLFFQAVKSSAHDTSYFVSNYLLRYKHLPFTVNDFTVIKDITGIDLDANKLASVLALSTDPDNARAQGASIASMLTGFGSMDVTKIADGFAQFIVKRTKQELNMAFFENFKEQLEKMPYLQALFPATYKTLTSAGTDIYNYNRYLESLRQSFEEDLSNLLQNTEVWVEGNNQADPLLNLLGVYIPNFRPLMLTALYFTNQLMNHTHPGIIIANFDESIIGDINNIEPVINTGLLEGIEKSGTNNLVFTKVDDHSFTVTNPFTLKMKEATAICTCNATPTLDPNIQTITLPASTFYYIIFNKVYTYEKGPMVTINNVKITEGVRFIKLISRSFRSDNDSMYWVKPEEVYGKLLQNETAMGYYLTLLYLESRKNNIDFFVNFMQAHSGNVAKVKVIRNNLRADIRAIISKTNSLNTAVLRVKNDVQAGVKPDIKNIFEFVNSTNELLNSSLDLSLHTTLPVDTQQVAKVRRVLKVISQVTHIAQDISSRSYNSAISKTIELLASNFPRDNSGNNYLASGGLFKTMEFMNKYGQFMASVVNAKDAKEVSDIIENTVLPPGSSRIKKETDFSISLNAYCGFEGGGERYLISKDKYIGTQKINHGYFGLSAPIGFAFNWGHRRNQFNKLAEKQKSSSSMSHSLFVQLFDIGAIVAFRFADDSSAISAKIELNKIFSPGLSYVYGIPKVPLALKAGVQISPAITKVNSKDITYQPYTTFRYTISLLLDIPMFNLYTSDKKIKLK